MILAYGVAAVTKGVRMCNASATQLVSHATALHGSRHFFLVCDQFKLLSLGPTDSDDLMLLNNSDECCEHTRWQSQLY